MPTVPPQNAARRQAFARAREARLIQRIETEHFVIEARQRAPGRLCHYTVRPVSAAAREWIEGQGAPVLQARARIERFADVCLEVESRLRAYWGPALDTRREW